MTPLDWSRPAGAEEIRAALASLRSRDLPTHGGRTLSYVYDSGIAAADEIGREALTAFAATNGLDPTAFPSLAAMESDLVGLARDLLDAHEPEDHPEEMCLTANSQAAGTADNLDTRGRAVTCTRPRLV